MPQSIIVSGRLVELTDEDITKFHSLVIKRESACWEWIGPKAHKGYGHFCLHGKEAWEGPTWPAHRISFALFRGEVPAGMLICHKCDNPPCCNPDHLFLGTHQDNMRDAMAKGRIGGPRKKKLAVI